MAPGRVACAGIAAVAVFSSGVVGRAEGQSTAPVMRAHDFQAQPDLGLLRDVEFIRRRYEEARALLANEQSNSGGGCAAIFQVFRCFKKCFQAAEPAETTFTATSGFKSDCRGTVNHWPKTKGVLWHHLTGCVPICHLPSVGFQMMARPWIGRCGCSERTLSIGRL